QLDLLLAVAGEHGDLLAPRGIGEEDLVPAPGADELLVPVGGAVRGRQDVVGVQSAQHQRGAHGAVHEGDGNLGIELRDEGEAETAAGLGVAHPAPVADEVGIEPRQAQPDAPLFGGIVDGCDQAGVDAVVAAVGGAGAGGGPHWTPPSTYLRTSKDVVYPEP